MHRRRPPQGVDSPPILSALQHAADEARLRRMLLRGALVLLGGALLLAAGVLLLGGWA